MNNIGTIHDKSTYFFRIEAGEATLESKSYELSVNASGNTPIVRSNQTGKFFTLTWQDIINMAIDAGIDQ